MVVGVVCGLMAAAYWPAQGQGVKGPEMTVKPVATEVRPIEPEMARRFAALHPKLQPSARTWVEQQARLEAQKPTPDVAGLGRAIRRRSAPNPRATARIRPAATLNPCTSW
jgi:hypothetical protein